MGVRVVFKKDSFCVRQLALIRSVRKHVTVRVQTVPFTQIIQNNVRRQEKCVRRSNTMSIESGDICPELTSEQMHCSQTGLQLGIVSSSHNGKSLKNPQTVSHLLEMKVARSYAGITGLAPEIILGYGKLKIMSWNSTSSC